MVKPSKILSRKVAKFEKKQEARVAAENSSHGAKDKALGARKATKKTSAKLRSKDSKKEVKKIHIAENTEGNEGDAMDADERKALRIEKLKANVKAKRLGLASNVSLETAVAHAQATINKKGGTSLNLKSAQRHDVFVSELNHFNKARSIPEFNADPFGTIEAHLIQTAPMLRKQTPDIGRRVEQKGPVQRHAGYGAGSRQ